MSSPEKHQRHEPRTPHRSAVWMKPLDESGSLVGETRNVSSSGMFVNVVPTPQLGQEVVCELPGHEAVRGRVVWVSMPPDLADHGVGIEFVDLSKQGDGPTYAGVDLAGPLDFLEAGTELNMGATADGRSLKARIAHVDHDTCEGHERLSMSLVMQPEARAESWFPDIDVDVPRSAAPRVATPIWPVDPILTEVQSIDLDGPELPLSMRETAQLDGRDLGAAGPEVIAVVALEGWESVDHTERNPLEPDGAPTPRRSLWPFAAVAGVVLAGLIVLRVGSPAPAPLPIAPAPIVEEPAPIAIVAAPPVSDPVEAAAPIAAAPAPTLAAPPIPVKAAEAGPWKPEVTELAGHAAILLPITGTADGMSHFALDRPQGLAVDLPHARAATPIKSWLLHGNTFESLWVRTMPSGSLQIRVHVRNGVKVKADVVDGKLRFVRQ